MDTFTENDLRELVQLKGSTCISVYMPTFRTGSEMQQHPIRFKNLLALAEEKLVSQGLRRSDAGDMLAEARKYSTNTTFWTNQADGLALFISKDYMRFFRLPMPFPEISYAGKRFFIKPLIPLLSGNSRYYLLCLSMSGPKFYTGSQYRFLPIKSESLPGNLDDTLGFDTMEKNSQFSSQPAVVGSNATTVFGYGRQTDKKKVNILNYFHRINDAVHGILRSDNAPLILAGVEYLHPIYRDANTYPYLVEAGIHAPAEELSEKDLHERSWEILRPMLKEKQQKLSNLFRQLHGEGSPIASSEFSTIVKGAKHGRVETLFVGDGRSLQWGKFNETDQNVEVHNQEQPGDDDLLDLATEETILHGGLVYIVDQHDADLLPMSALLRY